MTRLRKRCLEEEKEGRAAVRKRKGLGREEAHWVRSNLFSKFLPSINQQIPMPDLEHVLQLVYNCP